jgi:uncharacterized protein YbjT (DUF2867 family)
MPFDSRQPRAKQVTSLSSSQIVTLIGGSGFIGRHVARALAKRGYRVRVACRRPDLAGHVQPLGFPGQVMPVQANVRYPQSLAAVCEGATAVVNFTGLLGQSGAQSFDAVHVFGAEASAKAARAAKAQVFIQMSAIGSDPQSPAAYGRTKAEGESRTRAVFPGAIMMRPSIVFGPEDDFFNKFAAMSRFAPALPLIGGGETKFQPVFVGDVAEAIALLVDQGVANGRTYELGGPDVLSFRQLLQFTLDTVGRKRVLLPIPWPIARIMGTVMGILPGAPLTRDQVELLTRDNIVSEEARREGRDLNALGIDARGIEGIVPSYLYRFRKAGQFSATTGAEET